MQEDLEVQVIATRWSVVSGLDSLLARSNKYVNLTDTGELVSVTWSTTPGRARNRISMHKAEKRKGVRREEQLPVLLLARKPPARLLVSLS